MPLVATRLIRKMRGGSQAHLLQAEDQRCYVVKFSNNPQHRRILVNEMLATVFLQHLQLATPEAREILLTEEFLAMNPEIYMQVGPKRIAVEPGWHYGSLFPGDPDRTAVYDFLPDSLLNKVNNLRMFVGMLVFDKWVCNADARQSVFVRDRLRAWLPESDAHPLAQGFIALMVDHGFAFNGPHWNFPDAPLHGLYFRPSVYNHVTDWEAFQPWLERLVHLPDGVFDDALKRIPPQWVDGEHDGLSQLLERLYERRERVPELILAARKARTDPFPRWHLRS